MPPRLLAAAFAAAAALLLPAAALASPCPNIMLVLDQSGSMDQDPSGGQTHPTKWELMVDVISQVVQQYGDHVPFGLLLFTSNAFRNDAQCLADAQITVPLGHGSAPKILAALSNASPLGQTNTGEAIQVASQQKELMDGGKPDYILLVTDGDPDCNLDDKDGTATYTLAQIQTARNATPSISTFVVGFDGSGGVNPLNLDHMAYYGGKSPAGCQGKAAGSPCYYSVSDAEAFRTAIFGIISDAGGGEFGGALCDDSCYSSGCPAGQVCETEELNPAPHCVADACLGKKCEGGQFCKAGACVTGCSSGCRPGETCSGGACVLDKCRTVHCASDQVCNPNTGSCGASPCPTCTDGGLCDFETGLCVADQCRVVKCPSGTTCVNNGNCIGSPKTGCAAAGRAGSRADLAPLAALLGAIAVAAAVGRGRRRLARAAAPPRSRR